MARNYLIGIFLGIIVLPFGATQILANDTGSQCESLLRAKCTHCHYETRVCQKLGKKSKRGWRATVRRMVKHGAELSKEEQKVLVECLSTRQKGAEAFCR